MPRPSQSEAAAPPRTKELSHVQCVLSARQQREILRYGANFGVDSASVLREVQASVAPAVEQAIAALAEASEGYEKAKADQERSLRAQFRRADVRPMTPERAAPALAAVEPPEAATPATSYARTGS